ncbi:13061_t:CDS:2, partial [Cetraspora pellucida]
LVFLFENCKRISIGTNIMDFKASKVPTYQSKVIELSDDTDDELTDKSDRIDITTSNSRSVQRQLCTLSYESNTTNNSGSVFNISSSSKSLSVKNSNNIESYNNFDDMNSITSDSLENEIDILNNSLKNNIINNSFETNNNNESNIFTSDL